MDAGSAGLNVTVIILLLPKEFSPWKVNKTNGERKAILYVPVTVEGAASVVEVASPVAAKVPLVNNIVALKLVNVPPLTDADVIEQPVIEPVAKTLPEIVPVVTCEDARVLLFITYPVNVPDDSDPPEYVQFVKFPLVMSADDGMCVASCGGCGNPSLPAAQSTPAPTPRSI